MSNKLTPHDIQSMMDEDYFDEEQTSFQKRVKQVKDDSLPTTVKKKDSHAKFVKPLHKQYPETK